MKDLGIWLGLVSAPALMVALLVPRGFEAFRDQAPAAAPARMVAEGQSLYARRCAVCHGRLGEGTARGPLLIAPAPGAGSPEAAAFRRAVRDGVPKQCGQGGMAPITDLRPEDIDGIIAFLRRIERPGETP